MNKSVALAITLAGSAFAIGAWNPIVEPNLHPNPWVVCSGALVAAIGACLLAFRVTPREPGFRAAGISVIVAMAGLAATSLGPPRHGLHALAVAGDDQSCNISRGHATALGATARQGTVPTTATAPLARALQQPLPVIPSTYDGLGINVESPRFS